MEARIAAAETAIREGRKDAAIAELSAMLAEDPRQSAEVYLALIRQLYLAGRYEDAERWTAKGLEHHIGDYGLWNLRGAALRQLKRPVEALDALERAIALDPGPDGARINRGSVLLDLKRPAEARAAFSELADRAPQNPVNLVNLARAEAALGKAEAARARIRQGLALKPDYIEAWLLLTALAADDGARALAVLEEGLAANPEDSRLAEAKAVALRTADRPGEAEAYLASLLPRLDGEAWVHFQLGMLILQRDRSRAIAHLRRAHDLAPGPHPLARLAHSLAGVRGPDEGASLDEAWALARQVLAAGYLDPGVHRLLAEIFSQVCAFEELDRLGDFRTLGRAWAENGQHLALLRQLPRVRSFEDRLELLEQHRIWARAVEARAAAAPIRRGPPRPADGRIRLGVLSSDLMWHPVGFFALPLFDHLDHTRFDVFCYSFHPGEGDALQARIAQQATAFRRLGKMGAREAAQIIADDNLDLLIEIGGSTGENKADVLAYRPAPVQASWLGYPHSVGLEAIDYFICDPHTVPPDRRLLAETPLMLPQSWIAFSEVIFEGHPPLSPGLPQDRTDAITFGTANAPYKFNPEVLRAWARVVAATPGSRFAIVRPEAASAVFRSNVLAAFAAEGVTEERLVFHAVRGVHLALYNEIDISLDTFPLTGGTTTVEALSMGVPVVSLKGEAPYERLSASILTSVDLEDLVADDLEGFVGIARKLAADKPRRTALRQSLRQRMSQSPLGRTEDFARAFYDLLAGAVART
jgi:Tfp pilus assembly protein PilF